MGFDDFMYARFCVCFIGLIILYGSIVSLTNMIVDPYGVWNTYQSVGFNQWKLKAEDKERLIKPINVSAIQPNTIFLGNSRALDALDASTYQSIYGRTAYNMSVPGMSMYEARRYIEHAIAVDDNLQEVILCVDFEMFVENEEHPIKKCEAGFDEAQLGHREMTGENLAATLMSWQAFKDSIETFYINERYQIDEPYFAAGRYDEVALDYRNHKLEAQFHSALANQLRNGDLYTQTSLSDEAFAEFQQIIDICQRHDISLTSLILPTHARMMESRTICWDVFEAWRKRLVQITPLVCFDFYNEKSTTFINGLVEKDTDDYYWEVSHPKKKYGDLVLSFLANNCDEPDIGMYVTADNIEENIQALRKGRVAWEKAHPESIEEVRYFNGFHEQVPSLLVDVEMSYDEDSLPIELNVQNDKVQFRQSDLIEVSGVRQLRGKNILAAYGILVRNDGKAYYALAEPMETKNSKNEIGLMGFLNKHHHDMNGIRLNALLKNVESGEYDVYIWEVDAGGEIFKSPLLKQILVS